VNAQGDWCAFRTFQNQLAQRGRAVEQPLRHFMATIKHRKAVGGASIVVLSQVLWCGD
jgi:hypothetical protein